MTLDNEYEGYLPYTNIYSTFSSHLNIKERIYFVKILSHFFLGQTNQPQIYPHMTKYIKQNETKYILA